MNKFVYTDIFLLVLFVALLGLYVGVSLPILVAIAIFFLLLKTNRHTAGFYLLMYGGVIGGTIRSLYPFIPLYGLILNVIGLYLVRDLIKQMFYKQKSSLVALLLVFGVLGISYFVGPQNAFSTTKMVDILQNGIFFLFAYFTIDKSDSFRIVDSALLLLFTSVFLIAFAENNYQITPSSIFDFNWFRQGLGAYRYMSGEPLLVDYQEVGMDATYAFALLLSLRERPKRLYILVAIALFITLMSGARQSLAACVAVIFLRYAYFNSAKSLKKVLLLFFSCLLVYVVYILLQSSNIDAITNTFESGDEERTYIWLLSLKLFYENQLLGIGLGGFAGYSIENPWPHNLVLEILCECGILGLISFVLVTVVYVFNNKVRLKHLTRTGMFFFLSLIPLIVRIMVSADFRLSIAFFCAIFAVSGLTNLCKRRI